MKGSTKVQYFLLIATIFYFGIWFYISVIEPRSAVIAENWCLLKEETSAWEFFDWFLFLTCQALLVGIIMVSNERWFDKHPNISFVVIITSPMILSLILIVAIGTLVWKGWKELMNVSDKYLSDDIKDINT